MSIEFGRIAFRREGEFWNAYWAETGTMDGAIPVGSIRMALVLENEEARETFVSMMQEAVVDYMADLPEEGTTWTQRQAPEHEKAGNA